jgi:hypothetical protein
MKDRIEENRINYFLHSKEYVNELSDDNICNDIDLLLPVQETVFSSAFFRSYPMISASCRYPGSRNVNSNWYTSQGMRATGYGVDSQPVFDCNCILQPKKWRSVD